MGFYSDVILPERCHRAMRDGLLLPYRKRVIGADEGRVRGGCRLATSMRARELRRNDAREKAMKPTPRRLWSFAAYAIAFVSMPDLAALPAPIDAENVSAARSRGPPKAVSDEIASSDIFPYPSVGRFRGILGCTAAIVLDARIILTAAHCVVGDNRSPRPTTFYFESARQAGAVLDRIEAKVWAIGAPQASLRQSVRDVSNDWAILVLEHAPATARPLRLGPSRLEPLNSYERRLLLPSYSIDSSSAWTPTVDTGCSPRHPISGVLTHDCQASYGSSGAPLLIRDRDWYAVVGTHTGSMFAADEDGRVAGLIGNTAVGVQAFSEAIQALVQRLNRGDNVYGAGPRVY